MKLWKMHGAGNDFLLMDNRQGLINDKSDFAAKICDRHFGVGADGFIALEDADDCDIKMSYYNADGTEDAMCGNGIRCLSKFARDLGVVKRKTFTVETQDGVKEISILNETEKVSQVRIGMGSYTFSSKEIGIDTHDTEFIDQKLQMKDGRLFEISCIRLGVNHSAIFVEDDLDYVGLYGNELEQHPIFLADMNINFVKYIDPSHLEVSTWERGVGRTLACGTGICSSVVIAARRLSMDSIVNIKAPGGMLRITTDEKGCVFMEGPAEKVAEILI